MLALMDTPTGCTKLGTLFGVDFFIGATDIETVRQVKTAALKAFGFQYKFDGSIESINTIGPIDPALLPAQPTPAAPTAPTPPAPTTETAPAA